MKNTPKRVSISEKKSLYIIQLKQEKSSEKGKLAFIWPEKERNGLRIDPSPQQLRADSSVGLS
jgi:hypothetical protein